jgi:putative endonuclease
MESFVYILFSEDLDRFYTGLTTLTIDERLENHLEKKYSELNYTQKTDDWELFYAIKCEDFSQARKIELHIKRMKSKIYIQNLVKYPEITEKLLEKYMST